MEQLKLIQLTPQELQNTISKVLKLELKDFKKELNTHNPNELLTRAEACKFLKIEQTTLYHWERKGRIKMYGIGNRRYLKKAELMQCLILKK